MLWPGRVLDLHVAWLGDYRAIWFVRAVPSQVLLCSCVRNWYLNKIILKYYLNNLVTLCCCVMFAYPNVVTIMSLTWLIGMAISVLYTVPLILLAKYHQSSSYVRKVSAVRRIHKPHVKIQVTAWDKTELWTGLCDIGVAKLLWPIGDVNCRRVF